MSTLYAREREPGRVMSDLSRIHLAFHTQYNPGLHIIFSGFRIIFSMDGTKY